MPTLKQFFTSVDANDHLRQAQGSQGQEPEHPCDPVVILLGSGDFVPRSEPSTPILQMRFHLHRDCVGQRSAPGKQVSGVTMRMLGKCKSCC